MFIFLSWTQACLTWEKLIEAAGLCCANCSLLILSVGPQGSRRLVSVSVWSSGTHGSLQPNDEKGNGMRSSLPRKVTQKSSAVCQDTVRLGWGRWFSPKGMELLAGCLFHSSSSEAPWSQDAAFNDSVVCLAVADLAFLERININTFFCLSFIFFPFTHCTASYFTVCCISPAPKEAVIRNYRCLVLHSLQQICSV